MSKGKTNLYNADFKKYFDEQQQRNYWVLGYFGGGSVNISDAMEVAKDFAKAVGVPIESVQIDEIFKSSRYKGFKYVFSKVNNQTPEADTNIHKNLFDLLTD